MAFLDLFNTPGSPHWWLLRLNARLDQRNLQLQLYEDYYEGDQRLAFATSKFRNAFGELFNVFASNWCKLIADAPVERLSIDGFRFGGRQGDVQARRMWQANALDAESVLAHTDAVKLGTSYLLVQPGGDLPSITVEHPTQVIVATAEGSRRQRAAALKRWISDDGKMYATVYLPEGIYRFERGSATPNATPLILPVGVDVGGWRERAGVAFEENNPLRVVPVVPLENDPHLLKGGRSDLDDVIPLQDAVNKTIMDMIVANEFHGFPQRWATGIEIPVDPETGKPRTDQFLGAQDRVWTVPEGATEGVQFGSFPTGNPSNYIEPVNMLVRHISAQTRTPPHYLIGEIVNASGDALKAAETGLVKKVERKQLLFGEAWEEAMRLAFRLSGDEEKGRAFGAETIWGEAESRSWGELVDAAVKLRTLNVPYEAIWEFLGFSQEQIEQFRATVHLPPPPAPAGAADPLPAGPDPAAAAA